LIDEAYAMAQNVLRKHRKGLDRLAAQLLEKEVLFTDDLVAIFGKRKKDIAREQREAHEAGASAGAGGAGMTVATEAAGAGATEVTIQSAEPAPKRRGRPQSSTKKAAKAKEAKGEAPKRRGRPSKKDETPRS